MDCNERASCRDRAARARARRASGRRRTDYRLRRCAGSDLPGGGRSGHAHGWPHSFQLACAQPRAIAMCSTPQLTAHKRAGDVAGSSLRLFARVRAARSTTLSWRRFSYRFVTDIPVLAPRRRRHAPPDHLGDEFYDRGVNGGFGAAPPAELYQGERLSFDFRRPPATDGMQSENIWHGAFKINGLARYWNSGIVRLTDAEQSDEQSADQSRASRSRRSFCGRGASAFRRRMAGCRVPKLRAAAKRNWVRRAARIARHCCGSRAAHGNAAAAAIRWSNYHRRYPFLVDTLYLTLGQAGYGVSSSPSIRCRARRQRAPAALSQRRAAARDQRIWHTCDDRVGAHECPPCARTAGAC